MTDLMFSVEFHSRFRVGDAYPRDGVDLTTDLDDPLPADHLKGLMRASARELHNWIGTPVGLIEEVFGTFAGSSWWGWTAAQPILGNSWLREQRNRVRIDPQTHSAQRDMLVFADEVGVCPAPVAGIAAATFEIYQLGDTPARAKLHHALLRLSARNVRHVGGWRRRGLGWVTITPTKGHSVAQDLAALASGDPSS